VTTVPGAPLQRPANGTVLRDFAGLVPGPPDRVFELVLERVRPLSPEGGNLSTDPITRLIVVQGGWWFRAEYRVTSDPVGSRLGMTIVNVAKPAHWAGPLTGRSVLRASGEAFEQLVEELGNEQY
jgi:hypothetical protein